MRVNTKADICNPDKVLSSLLSKVELVTESGCWIWTASVDGCGYGHIAVGGRGNSTKAHRVAHVLLKGDIPNGMIVRHKCDVPSCCNPAHLEVGSHADNRKDAVDRGRVALGVRHGKAKLTPNDVERIVRSPETERGLSKLMGIPRSTINSVRSGRAWSHLTSIRQKA